METDKGISKIESFRTNLQYFPADETTTVSALNTVLFLVISFAVRNTIATHIFAVQHRTARTTLKAPNMPLTV